jgi:hypothetical protein
MNMPVNPIDPLKVAAIEARVDRIEHELAKNTRLTEKVLDSTEDLVVFAENTKGFFAIVNGFIRVLKPLIWMVGLVAGGYAGFKLFIIHIVQNGVK